MALTNADATMRTGGTYKTKETSVHRDNKSMGQAASFFRRAADRQEAIMSQSAAQSQSQLYSKAFDVVVVAGFGARPIEGQLLAGKSRLVKRAARWRKRNRTASTGAEAKSIG